MANSIVRLPLGYFPDPKKGRPLFDARIYVGEPDTDPRIGANQKTVTGRQEDGTELPLSQPISTSAGGVPVDSSGNYVTLLVDGAYSMAVDDKKDAQVYYFADVLDGAPVTFKDLSLYTRYPFKTAEDAKSGTLADGTTTVNLEVGDFIETAGRKSVNDGGDGVYEVVAGGTGVDDGGLFINLDNGNQLKLIFKTPLNVKLFGAVDAGNASTPFSTSEIQAAVNTGYNVFFPAGTYLIDDEILVNTSGQALIGENEGARLGNKKDISNVQTILKVPLGTTIPRYVKTRRNARTSAIDPVDDPISCMINWEATGLTIKGIHGELECDYTNFDPANLGADCDVFIFNGCRGGQTIQDCTWTGYFRVGGILLDSTRGTNLPEFQAPSGVTYSSDGTNGGDQIRITRCQGTGGLKQVYLRGPILDPSGNYFDESTGLVSDTRGGSGNSDLYFSQNIVFEGRDHHSGYRAYDFVGDPDLDVIEDVSCPIMIDAVRGSASQGRTRRIHIDDVRLRTIEASRFFTARAYEVYFDWMHTEPLKGFSGTVFDTAGNPIDPSDTVNQTYGPLACQSTSGTDTGTDQVRADGIWGTGLVSSWCRNLVTNFSDTRDSINPKFSVTLDSDLTVGDDLFVTDTIDAGGNIHGASLTLDNEDTAFTPVFLGVAAPTYTTQIGKNSKIGNINYIDIVLTYSGLDTADGSPVNIAGLPENKDSNSGFITQINVQASDGLVNPYELYFDDNGTSTQVGLYDNLGVQLTYDGGKINAAGTIKFTLAYRS